MQTRNVKLLSVTYVRGGKALGQKRCGRDLYRSDNRSRWDTLRGGALGLSMFTKACEGLVGFGGTGLGECLAWELRQLHVPKGLRKLPTHVLLVSLKRGG